ncbi:DUF7269 family protein [Halorubrum vacuolatum]|uniref:Uncharacterized protein n=1 Tax=Halorubrum vacuolatum TaxID=63740 RepID=A0A238W0Q8_HALVU|nr:hypothetical protein [Halorubrum vacuolatum]SNR40140.1 hypothetical protein SAMN06264855_10513 [Halorubrum vacuolatum]
MRLRVAVGVATVLAGFILLFDHGLAGTIAFSTVAVTLVGAFAVVQGLRYANARRRAERRSLDPGEPERRVQAVVPGTEFDSDLTRAIGTSPRRYGLRKRLRERVRAVAITATARERNCSTARAADLVATGEWTDDPVAAAFLSPERTAPIGHRIRTRLLGRSTFRAGVEASMAAIQRADPLDTGSLADPEATTDGAEADAGKHTTEAG